MDQQKFERQSTDIVNALKALFTITGGGITYNGVLHMPGGDVEVIILGYAQDASDPLHSVKPLALL